MYEKIETLMKTKGVKASEVAKATGIRQSSLSDWKKGRSAPKAANLKKLADFFGVNISYFTDDDDEEGYYLNPETAKKAQELFEKPGMQILFDAARDASPEDLQAAADILILLKKKGNID